MMKRLMTKLTAFTAVLISALVFMAPVQAQTRGYGPYGDIDGYYTWQINGKGWTVYTQDNYSWVYPQRKRTPSIAGSY